jgi:hypothetical protein
MIRGVWDFIQQFSNRELAIAIWIVAFAGWAVCSRKTRASSLHLLKAFFAWKLTVGYLAMLSYVSLVLLALRALGVWQSTSVATILIWFVCVAFGMLFQWERANEPSYFRNAIRENIRLTILVEFVVNFYVLNLWLELLLVPLFAIIGAMIALCERDSKYDSVRVFLNSFMIAVGLALATYAMYMMITDFNQFATIANLENLFLPIILTLTFLPFVYLAVAFATYENLFLRLGFFIRDKSLLKYAKWKTLRAFGLSLNSANEWGKHLFRLSGVDKHGFDRAMRDFKSGASSTGTEEV